MSDFKYSRAQVIIHWLAALLIVFMLTSGTLMLAEAANTADKIPKIKVHAILGAIAALLIITRVILRKRLPGPPPLKGHKLAVIGHMALNLVILLMAMSGTMLMLQSGAFAAVFGSGALPETFHDFVPRLIHGLFAKIAIALIAVHIAAALYHQFIVKDGVMERMKFGR